MRKDVKFGLTIGGILVATLVVYVIVLSRGGSDQFKVAVAQPAPNDRSADTDSAQAPEPDSASHLDSTNNTASDQSDKTASSTDVNSQTSTADNVVTPPATQPTASADSKIDWDSALNRGMPPSLSASSPPERTM